MNFIKAHVLLAIILNLSRCLQLSRHLPAYTAGGAILKQGDYLTPNTRLASGNGYFLTFQKDGNLVLYKGEGTSNPLWSAKANGRGGVLVKMQDDGNLVLYDTYIHAIWSSNTFRKGVAPFRLIMQPDGNAVVYDGNSRPTWSTGTAGK